ncbi:ATP-binding protein [Frankia sp. R82]|uniref:ATP-binding protein n=1 Tax=Frankia sp. R82 TaxID=2950553 RepID=UPI00255B359D|nr:ATP-binding protein [Frankia sp. R82]
MSASSVPMDVVRQTTTRCPPATHILAELPYLPSAVPQARRVLREGMRLASIPEDVRSTAELLVSELVTNAVKYGEPPLWLFIEMRPGLIHASVSDTSTVLPQRRVAAADAEGGRGLLVLDALAGSWGTVAAESGKYLWFDLPVPGATSDPATRSGSGTRVAPVQEGTRDGAAASPGPVTPSPSASPPADPDTSAPDAATTSAAPSAVRTTDRSPGGIRPDDVPVPPGPPPTAVVASGASVSGRSAASFPGPHTTLLATGLLTDPARPLSTRTRGTADPRGASARPGRDARAAHDGRDGHGTRETTRSAQDTHDGTAPDPTIVTRLL